MKDERKKNIYIIIAALLFIILSRNIYSSIKSYEYRKLCDEYRKSLIATEEANRELADRFGRVTEITERIKETADANITDARSIIETLKPTYNSNRANGLDIDKRKKYHKKYYKEYNKSDKFKEYQKEYHKTNKYKEYQKEFQKEYQKEYYSQLCFYNGETLTLGALRMRFKSQGIPHPTQEAKKYLIKR